MSFEAFIFLSFLIGWAVAVVIFAIKEAIEKHRNIRRKERNKISQLEAVCEKQKRQLIFYRNEAEING